MKADKSAQVFSFFGFRISSSSCCPLLLSFTDIATNVARIRKLSTKKTIPIGITTETYAEGKSWRKVLM
jgi:hypothetical protein